MLGIAISSAFEYGALELQQCVRVLKGINTDMQFCSQLSSARMAP